jgi:hypothetical protein
MLTRVRRVRGYYISPVKLHPYFPFQLRYHPCRPSYDPKRGYTVEIGAQIKKENA